MISGRLVFPNGKMRVGDAHIGHLYPADSDRISRRLRDVRHNMPVIALGIRWRPISSWETRAYSFLLSVRLPPTNPTWPIRQQQMCIVWRSLSLCVCYASDTLHKIRAARCRQDDGNTCRQVPRMFEACVLRTNYRTLSLAD